MKSISEIEEKVALVKKSKLRINYIENLSLDSCITGDRHGI